MSKNCCVETALEMSGYSKMWDIWTDLSVFKQRLLDQFQQDWSASITSIERFEFYSIFKQSIRTEKYIDFLQLRCFREAYIKFRFGISPIIVHRLRYKNDIIPRDLCPVYKDEIEDESHVLFSYKAYEDFRKDVSWFNGSHTAALLMFLTLFQLMTRRLFGKCPVCLFLQSFAKEKRHCNFANWRMKYMWMLNAGWTDSM